MRWLGRFFVEVKKPEPPCLPGVRLWRAVGVRQDGQVFQAAVMISELTLLRVMVGERRFLEDIEEEAYKFMDKKAREHDEGVGTGQADGNGASLLRLGDGPAGLYAVGGPVPAENDPRDPRCRG
jgi:hypothetical protein